jgi:diaminopropionate ammonia-lyase
MHYKAENPNSRIVAVEPESAACLKESLHCGRLQAVSTSHTIMAGMCCGTPSVIAYPVLRDGISAAVAINEKESHESVEYLQAHGIDAGPCGAATLASMRKYLAQLSRDKRRSMSVVLFSTEGPREYDVPP